MKTETTQKEEKGITLIALAITIIVLLILAGVTIVTLTGDNGVLQKAGEAKIQSEIAEEKDIISISAIQAQSENKQGNLEENKFNEALNANSKSGNKASIIASDIGSFTVKFESNRYYEINKNGNINYVENATGEKILTVQCVNSKNEVLGEYEYTIVTNNYSKLPPSVERYESSEEKIEGEITEDKTIQVLYYLICNDDATLVFTGLDSKGNITSDENEIVNYIIGDGSTTYRNGLKSSASNIKFVLNIPDQYNNKPVVGIGGQFTFARSLVQRITFGNNLSSINRYGFAWCTDLKSIVINRKEGISFGDSVFEGCTKLEDVTLFVENILGQINTAFAGCTSLEKIKVNDDNEELVSDEEGIVYSKDKTKLIFYPPGKKDNFVFPDTVTAIGYGAFGGQCYITDIEIPERITNIGMFTFWGSRVENIICRGNIISREMFRHCGNLEEIVIGKNVTSIGRLIFYGDNKLEKITYEGTIEEWNSISKSGEWKIGMPSGLVVNCTDGTIEL